MCATFGPVELIEYAWRYLIGVGERCQRPSRLLTGKIPLCDRVSSLGSIAFAARSCAVSNSSLVRGQANVRRGSARGQKLRIRALRCDAAPRDACGGISRRSLRAKQPLRGIPQLRICLGCRFKMLMVYLATLSSCGSSRPDLQAYKSFSRQNMSHK